MAATVSGRGYWLVAADGGVFTFGDAQFYGSAGNLKLNAPVVGMLATRSGGGYWLVAKDGGVFAYGDARAFGSMGGKQLNQPMVGMAATPSGGGYWLVAADGGIFAFGDAQFYGSMGGKQLNKPMVGIAATPSGKGYWLVAADGGIFAFGDATFKGSAGNLKLNAPIVGMIAVLSGSGYWLVAADGGVFAYGDAKFIESLPGRGTKLEAPIVALAPTADGYWLLAADGGVFSLGKAEFYGRAVVATLPPTGAPQSPGERLAAKNRVISNQGIDFLKDFEKYEEKAYNDNGKRGFCTVGYGHLLQPKHSCTAADYARQYTKSELESLFAADTEVSAKFIRSRFGEVPLTQAEFDALASFFFNLGANCIGKETICRDLDTKSYSAVPGHLLMYVYSDGKKLCGLHLRRLSEAQMFAKGTYERIYDQKRCFINPY